MPEQSTTPDLVELTRRFGDPTPSQLDFLRFFADDALWEALPLGTRYHGIEEIREFLTDWFRSYEEHEVESREISDLGNGVILAAFQHTTRLAGGTTGTRIRELWVFVLVWERRTVTRVISYQDLNLARAAAEALAEKRGG